MPQMTTEQFIEKAMLVHGSKFGYTRALCDGKVNKVELECLEHGFFWQSPLLHLQGRGCPKCASEKRTKKMTTEQFIQKAMRVHGDKYIYGRTVYVGSGTAIRAVCKKHEPYWHLL